MYFEFYLCVIFYLDHKTFVHIWCHFWTVLSFVFPPFASCLLQNRSCEMRVIVPDSKGAVSSSEVAQLLCLSWCSSFSDLFIQRSVLLFPFVFLTYDQGRGMSSASSSFNADSSIHVSSVIFPSLCSAHSFFFFFNACSTNVPH